MKRERMNKMKQMLLKELHDAKIKMVNAINGDDKEMASKYQEVIKDLERALKLLEKSKRGIPMLTTTKAWTTYDLSLNTPP